MKQTYAVHMEDITMAYADVPVVEHVSGDIYENTITAIIGPNGAGKSTLIKGILELEKIVSGKVEILGKRYKDIYKEIAYIPQSGSVNWNFPTTVFDVVLMGRYVYTGFLRPYTKRDKELAKEAIAIVGLENFMERHISELSGGQKQRVFLARAIAQDARIYFMDEPFQGVDVKTEAIIMDTIRDFQKNGKTIVAVHHDLSTVEAYFSHVLLMNKNLIACGSIEDTFTKKNIARAYGEK